MRPLAAAPLLLLLAAALPSGAEPYGEDCGTESYAPPVQCWTVTGPGSTIDKAEGGVFVGHCDEPSAPVAPFACGAVGASTFGAAFIPAGFLGAGSRLVSVWATWTSGVFPPGPTGGFLLALCNDRDGDDVCSTLPGASSADQVWMSTSNEPVVGASCTDGDKDLKGCPDPMDAEVVGACIDPPASGVWADWQVRAYIADWTDHTLSPANVGKGSSSGTYDVWIRDHGAC